MQNMFLLIIINFSLQFLLGTLKKLKTENDIALQLAKYISPILSSSQAYIYIYIYNHQDFIAIYLVIDHFFFFVISLQRFQTVLRRKTQMLR